MKYAVELVFDPVGCQAQKMQICGGIPPYGTDSPIEPSDPRREVAIALSRYRAVFPFGTQSCCENTRTSNSNHGLASGKACTLNRSIQIDSIFAGLNPAGMNGYRSSRKINPTIRSNTDHAVMANQKRWLVVGIVMTTAGCKLPVANESFNTRCSGLSGRTDGIVESAASANFSTRKAVSAKQKLHDGAHDPTAA